MRHSYWRVIAVIFYLVVLVATSCLSSRYVGHVRHGSGDVIGSHYGAAVQVLSLTPKAAGSLNLQ